MKGGRGREGGKIALLVVMTLKPFSEVPGISWRLEV